MKIGFFTDTYFPQVNGVTFTLQGWRQLLEERGHEVHVYYPAGDYAPGRNEHPFASIGFWPYPEYRMCAPVRVPRDTKQLDIIHQHGLFGMAIAGLRASWAHSTPRLHTFHTPAEEYLDYLPGNRLLGGVYRRTYLTYERWLLNEYGHVTTGSSVIKDRLLANGIRDVEVLSNGLDLNLFHSVDASDFRQRHGIQTQKVIGFCGRLGYEKRLDDLILAADDFKGTILIAGDGPARGHYVKLAAGRKNVLFLGFLPRETLKEFYSALDVFVFPSFCETQGLVALESMACGRPVVAVPVLALKTTVEDDVTGYHFEPGNSQDLLEKVEKCYESMGRLSRGCLKEARRNSIIGSVDALERIYEQMT